MREGHGGEQCAARTTAGAQGVRRMRRAFEGHRNLCGSVVFRLKALWELGY